MDVHEYQAKQMLSSYGIQILPNVVARSAEEAVQGCQQLGSGPWVIKAQIYAGGRAKSGGIRFTDSLDEVHEFTGEILSKSLITTYSGILTKKVEKVLIEPKVSFEREYFVAITLDRRNGRVVMIASREGGGSLDTVVEERPESVVRASFDPATGYSPALGRKLAYGLGLKNGQVEAACNFFSSLYRLYTEKDCLNLEINPFIITADNSFVALDAKFCFDDSALFRQPDLHQFLTDSSDIICDDVRRGYTYLELAGNIGLFVNGAGLSLATYDAIKRADGEPANFIDINGNANEAAVEKAFMHLLDNSKVKVILVNIFGGIMKCDIIASGMIQAIQQTGRKVPLVVRMEGTHVALGKKILKESGISYTLAQDLQDACDKAVALAQGDK